MYTLGTVEYAIQLFLVMIGVNTEVGPLSTEELHLRMKMLLAAVGVLVMGNLFISLLSMLMYGLVAWVLYQAWNKENS